MTDSSSPWANNGKPNRRAPEQSSIRRAPAETQFVEPLVIQVIVDQRRGHMLEAGIVAAAILIAL